MNIPVERKFMIVLGREVMEKVNDGKFWGLLRVKRIDGWGNKGGGCER